MTNLTPEEEEKILKGAPKGTFALLLVFAVLFMGGLPFFGIKLKYIFGFNPKNQLGVGNI